MTDARFLLLLFCLKRVAALRSARCGAAALRHRKHERLPGSSQQPSSARWDSEALIKFPRSGLRGRLSRGPHAVPVLVAGGRGGTGGGQCVQAASAQGRTDVCLVRSQLTDEVDELHLGD